jgi:hypothetical protein
MSDEKSRATNRERQKRWREKHPEAVAAKNAADNEHRQQRRQSDPEWAQEQRDRTTQWAKENPEKIAAKNKKRGK